jgi:hypothetical protein
MKRISSNEHKLILRLFMTMFKGEIFVAYMRMMTEGLYNVGDQA